MSRGRWAELRLKKYENPPLPANSFVVGAGRIKLQGVKDAKYASRLLAIAVGIKLSLSTEYLTYSTRPIGTPQCYTGTYLGTVGSTQLHMNQIQENELSSTLIGLNAGLYSQHLKFQFLSCPLI